MKLDWIKEPQLEFLREGLYIEKNETPEIRVEEIVERVRSYEGQYKWPGLADIISEMIEKNYLSLSTPCLSNFGRKVKEGSNTTPLPASCNIITVPNSIAGIALSNSEVKMLSKLGAGVSSGYLNVSQKGTELSEGFYTNAKLDWIEDDVSAAQKVSQGAKRRGYNTPYLSILDKEFYDLLKRIDKNNPDKTDPLVNNTVGIVLPSGFWAEVDGGNKEYQKRMIAALKQKQKTGRLYFLDVDNCNKNCSPVYKKLGMEINLSNICCVTGDQMVATEYGFKTVKELSDTNLPLTLFDNESSHNSSAMLYRGYDDVYKITLKNGMSHTITSNHELVVREKSRKTHQKSIDTGLSVGQKVLIQTNKGLFGKKNNSKLAFLLGLFLGDGSEVSFNSTQISLWENDFDLIPEIENTCLEFYNTEDINLHHSNKVPTFVDKSTGDSDVRKKSITTSIFNNNGIPFKKGSIPSWIWDADEETHWQLLRGFLYADGTVGDYNKGKSFGNPINLSLASISLDLLKDLQLIASNLGLNVKTYSLREKSVAMLPKNDGTGKYKEYPTKKIDRLVLSNKGDLLKVEKNTKFLSRKGVVLEDKEYRDNSHKSSEIISIESKGKQDVYCPTVDSNKHLWVCNGFVTSNTEFIQPSFEDMVSVCVIAAINGVHWDYITEKMLRASFYFLDIMNEEYVKLTKGIPFMKRARRAAKNKRDIGLGFLGFHEMLQIRGFSYGDIYSRKLNKDIFKTIREQGEVATLRMGQDIGSPKLCRDAGMVRRNASLMMIAPNKSTSFISAATSGGFEPFMSNVFTKTLAKIQYVFKNKHLEKLLEIKGLNTMDIWESIEDNNGSVQHLDILSDTEKEVYKTFSEISPKDIIDLCADRQEYIDMGQSLNLIFRPNYTIKDIYDIHRYGFKKGIKTFYYGYASSHAAMEKSGKNWDDCASCSD